jgi:hypothetical protein
VYATAFLRTGCYAPGKICNILLTDAHFISNLTNKTYFTRSYDDKNCKKSLPPDFSGVRVTRSLVLYVCFVDRCLSFCTFSFGHCVVCSSIHGF